MFRMLLLTFCIGSCTSQLDLLHIPDSPHDVLEIPNLIVDLVETPDSTTGLLDPVADILGPILTLLKPFLDIIAAIIDVTVRFQDFFQPTLYLSLKAAGIVPDETGLTPPELIEYFGYQFEEHQVETEDGYLLALNRIVDKHTEGRPVVLFIPSVLCDSSVFLSKGPNRSLGLLLFEAGYDTWFLNPRGNTYSRKHKTLDPILNKEKFFNFTINEKGVYDLPNTIDYILSVTGRNSLKIIGHGEGATLIAILASEIPEYTQKISYSVFIQPIIYYGEIKQPLFKLIGDERDLISTLLLETNQHDFLPHLEVFTNLAALFCNKHSPVKELCFLFSDFMYGTDKNGFDYEHFPIVASALPAGISTKEATHIAYFIDTGRFGKFDYRERNQEVYGQDIPPDYNLKYLADIPIGMYYGTKDILVIPKNLLKLTYDIPNLAFNHCREDYGHLDPLFHLSVGDFNKLIVRDLNSIN